MALYKALRDEVIMAAGLDVMVEEPPKPDHELFTLKNAIFSPHAAGPTWDNHPKRWRNAFDNCERVARGQKRVLDRPRTARLDVTTSRRHCEEPPGVEAISTGGASTVRDCFASLAMTD